MSKGIAAPLKSIEKEIQRKSDKYQEQLNKAPKEKWFTKEFMHSVHLSETIKQFFDKANVDISHIDNLSDEEKSKLKAKLPVKFKTWDDFLKEAFAFNVKQFLSNL